METELRKLTINRILDDRDSPCVEFHFKGIGLVLFDRKYLDKEILVKMQRGSTVLANIDNRPIPTIEELYSLKPIYHR